MHRANSARSELPLSFLFFGLTAVLTLGAISLCINDSLFRTMVTLARQSDLLAQRYYGEVTPEQVFADAWRGMQQAIPFRVELVDEPGGVGAATPPFDWGLTLTPLDSTIKVMAVAQTSPFQGALQPDDEIIAVDAIQAAAPIKFAEYLSERESTYVMLHIRRKAALDSVQVLLAPMRGVETLQVDTIGAWLYVGVRGLSREAGSALRRRIDEQRRSQYSGMVVDLRRLRSSAYNEISDLNTIICEAAANMPLVALIDGNTVGAGERLAMQLREECGARLIGAPTAGINSQFEELRLRSGKRLLVSINERVLPELEFTDTLGAAVDAIRKFAERQRENAVLPDIECREQRLSPLTFELVHRGLIVEFVAAQADQPFPAPENEARIWSEFLAFLERRQFHFDPLGDALNDLEVHEVTPEMRPVIRRLRYLRGQVEPNDWGEYRDEILRQILETWYRVRVSVAPAPPALRLRFSDACLAEAIKYLQGAR